MKFLTGCGVLVFGFYLAAQCSAETWRSFPLDWDKAPINLSFLLDPPAGKHGFLGVKGDRFIFEDGTDIRFWGTTLTGSGCFPSQDAAPAIAERLFQFGINLVRFHEMDAEWAEPNLFAPDSANRELLNKEALDRLDYFLYQLEYRGIYAWMDGLSARRLREVDGILAWKFLPPGMKGYIYFAPDLQQAHRDFLQAFWSHRNRYTGNQYRDTPSIVLTELFSDNNINLDRPRIQPYSDLFKEQWRNFLQSRKGDPSREYDWETPDGEMKRFTAGIMGDTFLGFFNFLRSFSVKIPIASTNAAASLGDLPLAASLDFTQGGGLWNPPGARSEYYSNRRMADTDLRREGNLFSELAFNRIEKKPFVVSQWGEPWPCEFRAEMPLWVAAMARFQDWQGCISSNYRSIHNPETGFIGNSLESFNDPCVMGLMPAAALLFYRGGMQEARNKASMAFTEEMAYTGNPMTPISCQTIRLVDGMKVTVKPGSRASGKTIFSPTEPENLDSIFQNRDRNDFYWRDSQRGLVFVDAPQTQAAIGRLNQAKFDELKYMTIETDEDFAVVSASSLDNQPIPQSKDLWVTVVSQARNQGFHSEPLDELSARIIEGGHAPVQIRETPVRLFLVTEHKDWTIDAIDGNGQKGESLPYQVEDGRLSFRAGVHGTIFYRLSCKARGNEK